MSSRQCRPRSVRVVIALVAALVAALLGACGGAPESKPPLPAAARKIAEAEVVRSEGDWSAALEALRKAVEADPESGQAALVAGTLLTRMGLPSEAVVMLEMASRREPHDPRAYLRLAELYRSTGRVQIAHSSVEAAAKVAEGDAEVLVEVGRRRLEAGDVWGAAGALGAAVRAEPKAAEPRYLLGVMERRRQALGEAEAELRRAIVLDPGHARAKLELARLLIEIGRASEARAMLEAMAEAEGPVDPEVLRELAGSKRLLGRDAEAEALEVRAAAVEEAAAERLGLYGRLWTHPSDIALRRDLGDALLAAGFAVRAEGIYRGWAHIARREAATTQAEAWRAVARACLAGADLTCAERALGRALAAAPDDIETLAARAEVAEARGDQAAAEAIRAEIGAQSGADSDGAE